jgi:hypothetical protein
VDNIWVCVRDSEVFMKYMYTFAVPKVIFNSTCSVWFCFISVPYCRVGVREEMSCERWNRGRDVSGGRREGGTYRWRRMLITQTHTHTHTYTHSHVTNYHTALQQNAHCSTWWNRTVVSDRQEDTSFLALSPVFRVSVSFVS